MNIALFGGSFDPPHIGHQSIIENIEKTLDIDKLIVMPTFLNPFKENSHFDAQTRLDLMKDLCEEYDNIEISKYEVEQGRKVASIQTVNYLYSKYDIDKLYLVIGADNIDSLHKWKNFDELKTKVEFVVALRDNIKIDGFVTLNIDYKINSTRIRENLDITLIPNKIKHKVKQLWNKE